MNSCNIYRVRLIQSQRYAVNISAPSADLAEFFAEEIRKRAGAAPFVGGWALCFFTACAEVVLLAKAQTSASTAKADIEWRMAVWVMVPPSGEVWMRP